MKYSIRRNLFETNSSSVHVIAISNRSISGDLPKEINFNLGEFGFAPKKLTTINKRAAYLWTAICTCLNVNEIPKCAEKISSVMEKYGIKCTFNNNHDDFDCYIDHGEELIHLVRMIVKSDYLLEHYLLSPKSIILTGNDNGYGELPVFKTFEDYILVYKKWN